ncbi:uncharacterized protein LOC135939762 [Cloeon dipterum]|uniref:uncharacterized protein LOC135939762 n=1 Tax=Cloeon dipterum TaxID=197152 RepID=UPI00321F799D
MVGRAVRVLFALGTVLVVTLVLCNDETSLAHEKSVPREMNADSGGGRTKLNGELHEIDFTQLLKETMKSRQRSDMMGRIFSSAMKRLFYASHSRQRRSSSFQKLFAALSRRKTNPYWHEMPPQAPSVTTPSTTMTTTQAPTTTQQTEPTTVNVVMVTEVNVLNFESEHLRATDNRVMITTNAEKGDAKNFALIADDCTEKSASVRSSAASCTMMITCFLVLLRHYVG